MRMEVRREGRGHVPRPGLQLLLWGDSAAEGPGGPGEAVSSARDI